MPRIDCSGLPGRTTLRRLVWPVAGRQGSVLFRSSRPDYIETFGVSAFYVSSFMDCSGLPGRTTLRLGEVGVEDATEGALFRSSRPDYIETSMGWVMVMRRVTIVPVFQAGLH